MRAYARVAEARASIGRYLSFYNGKRPHSSLGGKTPDQAYINLATPIPAAAREGRLIHLETPRTVFRQTEPPLATGSRKRPSAIEPYEKRLSWFSHTGVDQTESKANRSPRDR